MAARAINNIIGGGHRDQVQRLGRRSSPGLESEPSNCLRVHRIGRGGHGPQVPRAVRQAHDLRGWAGRAGLPTSTRSGSSAPPRRPRRTPPSCSRTRRTRATGQRQAILKRLRSQGLRKHNAARCLGVRRRPRCRLQQDRLQRDRLQRDRLQRERLQRERGELMPSASKPRWQQMTALVSLGTGGAITRPVPAKNAGTRTGRPESMTRS